MTPKDYQIVAIALGSMSSVMLISFLRLTGLFGLIAIGVLIFICCRALHAFSATGGRMQQKDWIIAIAPGIGALALIGIFAAWGW